MNLILAFKNWYEYRQIREKLLLVCLTWIILYAIFSLSFFYPMEREKNELAKEIKEATSQIDNWNTQIAALNKIPSTQLYQEWLKHHHSLSSLEDKYKFLLQTSPTIQLQEIINTILASQNNITLVQIKNSPEQSYRPALPSSAISNIYLQKFSIVIYGNYISVFNYLQRLEKALPNIYWNNIEYEVIQYPIAKVQMELSVFYEKQ